MGQKPDELEREIARQRQTIERKIDGMRERLRADAEDGRNAVSRDASKLADEATRRLHIEEQVDAHPLASIGAAFATGLTLGLISEGLGGNGSSSSSSNNSTTSSGPSFVSELLGTVTGSVGSTAKDELLEFVRSAFEETKVAVKEEMRGDDGNTLSPHNGHHQAVAPRPNGA